jgi:hypothetical protein
LAESNCAGTISKKAGIDLRINGEEKWSPVHLVVKI